MFKLILLLGIVVSIQDNDKNAYVTGEVTCCHIEKEYYLDGNKWTYKKINSNFNGNIGVYLVNTCYDNNRYTDQEKMMNAEDFYLTKNDGKFVLKGRRDEQYKIMMAVGGKIISEKFAPVITKDKITNISNFKVYYHKD